MIDKLDGFTADGLGNIVVPDVTPEGLVTGDVIRVNGVMEYRYTYVPESEPEA